MVACGAQHTLVLTVGGLWTCGKGNYGALGHGDEADKLVLTQVAAECFKGNAQIVMVAAGVRHSAGMGAEGGVWTWGTRGCLGHKDMEDRHLPTLLGAVFGGGKAVMVAAAGSHTVVVTSKREPWAWGLNTSGQLGTVGPEQLKLTPTLVGGEDVFGGSPVRMAASGARHTLIVTEEGVLWACGEGEHGALGLNDSNDRQVPTRVEAQHFGDAKIVSAAAGYYHSAASMVASIHGERGKMLRIHLPRGWVTATCTPSLCVAQQILQGARVGRCHKLPPFNALAFVMGTHARLGSVVPTSAPAGGSSSRRSRRLEGKTPAATADTSTGCAYVTMPGELVQRVVEACASWPEGWAGELEGVVRLLGGMIKDKVSQ